MTSTRARRLLAVMFTDVVGYTAMMHRDEDQARMVRRRHREALETAVAANHGDVLQYLGDGSLTMFPSVADAARAAIEIQGELRQEPAVPLRIGVHQGDISYDTQGPYGDSMNVASRIQSLGTAGSVLISAKAQDEIKNRPDIATAPLGEFELKGVDQSYEVYAIVSNEIAVPTREDVLATIHGSAPVEHTTEAIAALNGALEARYSIEREIGEGGMATVYLADDLRHERKVALKVLKPELAAVVGTQRFLGEIKTTANLQHPHIVPLFDSGEAGGAPFYVMPYVAGESLEQRLRRDGPLSIDEALSIACDVAGALQSAHGRGVIDRDIKPANILLTAGRPLVADFGIAAAVAGGGDRLTQAGASLGTPAYMSPEQAGGGTRVDARTDVYSLGCVLYEMVTGAPPFTGSTVRELLTKILVTDAVPPRVLRESTPVAVESTILKALEKLPANRFATADEFVQALKSSSEAASADGSLRAISRTGPRPSGRWSSRFYVAVAAAVVLFIAGWFATPSSVIRGAFVDIEPQSLAVLPLINLIGDPAQEYFVSGMHEALISELAQLGALDVISRTSVSRYADTELSAPQIARELGVTSVLEGGVQRDGDRVRVNVRLIDGRSDQQLWGESYDQELTTANIFAIQSDVARQIAAALRTTLAPEVEGRIQAQPTESFEAYDLYTRGRYLYNRFANHDDRVEATDLFEQAILADSSFPLAYVGLAEAYSFLSGQGYLPADETLPKARAAAERALQLDETLGAAHAALGSVLLAELEYEQAEQEFLRALELSPSSADIHRQYGRLLNRLSRADESVREARRAVELDPLSIGNRVSLTSRLFNARQYDDAISEGINVLQLEPDDIGALFFLGISYVLTGQFDDGVASLSRAVELDPDNPFRVTALAFAHARYGNRAEAIELLQGLEERGGILKEMAIVYGELGELDRAFTYLHRAFDEDPASLTYLPSDPTADSLRADPRMGDLMRQVGLE